MPDLPHTTAAVPAHSMPAEIMFQVEEQALQPTPVAFGPARSALSLRPLKRGTALAAAADGLPSAQVVSLLGANDGILARKPAAVGLAHVIGALQHSLRNGSRGLVIQTAAGNFQTPASPSAKQVGAGILGYALWGMLRAASTELPTLTWSGTARSVALPSSFKNHEEGSNVRTRPEPLLLSRKLLKVQQKLHGNAPALP
jgi:hypothetical protein